MVDTEWIDLEDSQVRCFQDQGFLSLGRITTDHELVWLRKVCDEIVKQKLRHTPEESGAPSVELDEESLITIVSPEKIAPALMDTSFYRNTQRVFMRLFNVEQSRLLNGWRIFCKPAQRGETPWHQDAAYRLPPHRSAGVWMPLDHATIESSCLFYLAGSHHGGLRPHHFHDDHLVVDDVDTTPAVACPLPAGEAIVHHCCTLHYTSPNKTDQPRRALVIVCQPLENYE